MSTVSMTGLLLSEEDKIRTELQADATVDRSRKQTVARLADVYDRMLLRYNASNADDRRRQALADSEAAAVRDMLDLLLAGTAKKEIEKRRVRSGALICLLLSVIFGLITALLIRENYIAGCLSTAVAALFAFLSGRLWYGEREVRVRSELDPNIVWNTVRKSTETMDRKIEEFLAQEDVRIEELTVAGPQSAGMLSRDSVKLIGDLMEALDLLELWYRDLIMFMITRDLNGLVFAGEQKTLMEMASVSSYTRVQEITESIEVCRRRLQANVNPELSLELLLLRMKENFNNFYLS